MRLLRVALVLLASIGVASFAAAQTAEDPPKGNIGFFGAFTASASDGLDSGHGGGFSATYFFSRLVGVEGGYRRQSFDVTNTSENTLSGGKLAANVITVNAVVRTGSGSIQPYFSGGIVFYANSYTLDPLVAQELAEFNFRASESIESAVGFNLAGGADFQASPRIGFFVEGRYTIATADTTSGLTDELSQTSSSVSGEQKLSVFTVNGGIKIFF